MENGILKATGKSLEAWIQVVRKSNITKHTDIMNLLKAEHGISHGYANFIALKANKSDAASNDGDELVKMQYAGKETLTPIYEKLLSEIKKLSTTITITPKKDSVSIIGKRQFALIKPAAKTRIDLGLKIKDKLPSGRLEHSGPFGAMCSHRVQLTSIKEVDKELLSWLKEAYQGSI
jgi:hypothetical protein